MNVSASLKGASDLGSSGNARGCRGWREKELHVDTSFCVMSHGCGLAVLNPTHKQWKWTVRGVGGGASLLTAGMGGSG